MISQQILSVRFMYTFESCGRPQYMTRSTMAQPVDKGCMIITPRRKLLLVSHASLMRFNARTAVALDNHINIVKDLSEV